MARDPSFRLLDAHGPKRYVQHWGHDAVLGFMIYWTFDQDEAFRFVRSEVHALFNLLAICAVLNNANVGSFQVKPELIE